jgi:asparagine synthase (glutamine-hydrolysing)
MAHSIEARVPFLDHLLVELALALPLTDLVRRGVPKAALREALRGLVPDVVLRRRDKVGFETPTSAWLRNGLGELAGEVLASPGIRERGFINQAAALRLLERHRDGTADASLPLWRAVNLELWAREFLDR